MFVRLTVLDSFRGIFAVMIVLLHSGFDSHLYYLPIVRNSGVVVDFFFVLSGFVISLSFVASDHPVSARHFMIRRIGRLFPLHLAVLTAFIVVFFLKTLAAGAGLYTADPIPASSFAGFATESLFLVQAFRNETVYWLNFPAWSISVELWAYAVLAALSLAPRSTLPWLAGAVMIAAVLPLTGWVDYGFGGFFDNGLFRGVFLFFSGYMCHLAWLKIRTMRLPYPTFLEVGISAIILLQIVDAEKPWVATTLYLTFPVAILVFAFQAGAISRVLEGRPFRYLGTRSYSIYMIHVLVLVCLGLVLKVIERVGDLDLSIPGPVAVELTSFGHPLLGDAAMVGIVLLVCWLADYTWRLFEVPGQAFAHRMTGPRAIAA